MRDWTLTRDRAAASDETVPRLERRSGRIGDALAVTRLVDARTAATVEKRRAGVENGDDEDEAMDDDENEEKLVERRPRAETTDVRIRDTEPRLAARARLASDNGAHGASPAERATLDIFAAVFYFLFFFVDFFFLFFVFDFIRHLH